MRSKAWTHPVVSGCSGAVVDVAVGVAVGLVKPDWRSDGQVDTKSVVPSTTASEIIRHSGVSSQRLPPVVAS